MLRSLGSLDSPPSTPKAEALPKQAAAQGPAPPAPQVAVQAVRQAGVTAEVSRHPAGVIGLQWSPMALSSGPPCGLDEEFRVSVGFV
jgi:hypothetical protein